MFVIKNFLRRRRSQIIAIYEKLDVELMIENLALGNCFLKC